MIEADRREIADCLHRLARGIDRLDEALIRSSYHPDAYDYHGSFFEGGVEELVQWLRTSHVHRPSSLHLLTNITIDLDGDTAHVETYFMAPIRREEADRLALACGRYVDRFERRHGDWRILVRVVVTDMISDMRAIPIASEDDLGRRDRSDISYRRPLAGPSRWP